MLPLARLAHSISQPSFAADSPLLRLQVKESDGAVIVQLTPAPGVQIGAATPSDNSLLTIALEGQAKRRVFLPPSQSENRAELPRISDGRLVVVLDPGHGGGDPGAVGINGLQEKTIVLPIALQVAALLEQQGVQVILTRNTDQEVELEPRVRMAEQANATIFVSIHANSISLSRPDINGLETYYYSPDGQQLAQEIQTSVAQATGMRNIGVKSARFYVLRHTSMPAALVEVGFVTGRDDAPRLADPAFRDRIAEGIARGILQYVQRNARAG
jgi:N-acetylmuramoyl-L-alanine amidase